MLIKDMSSSKDYKDFILDQLSDLSDLTCRPMMGEFLLYFNGILFGGIYDNRLLVKIVPSTAKYHLNEAIPYEHAKPMYYIEDIDNKSLLTEIITTTVQSLTE